ncbi:RNA-directed DNA polymerase from mobile element jockey [Lucilia cuprina]|nr:RNA-directed DNA polymerase from mobile element jockey [Lucilia cuprina]
MDVRSNLGPVVCDNSFLTTELSHLNGNLNIGHLNCTSLNLKPNSSKFSEIKHILNGGILNVFGVSETWLNDAVSIGVADIPGYLCYRNDRAYGRGGGVALYISKYIEHKVVYKSNNYGVVEYLFVELLYSGKKVLVGVVYLPHGDFESFEREVSDLVVHYSHILIMGDFNNNMFDPFKSSRVRNICDRLGLAPIHNMMPTHFDIRYKSTSLIDYFLVSSPELVVKSGQFQCPSITRHSFIFLSIRTILFNTEQYYEYFDYKAVNIDSINAKISECNFNDIYLTNCVDEQVQILNGNLRLLHSLVPLKRRKIRIHSDDWINNPEIKYYVSLRDLAYTTYYRNKTDENWKAFCRYRNKAKSIIRKHKKIAHYLMFDHKSSKEIWMILNKNGVGRPVDHFEIADPNIINNAFLSNQICDGIDFVDVSNIPYDGFSFRSVSILELFTAFDLIKSKAVGFDGFSLEFLKLLLPMISNYVLHLVNTILMTSNFPSFWKIAKIVPIKKNSNVLGIDDLRPISILPILSKMVEHLIKIQLVDYINNKAFLHDCQSGFRCNRSATSLLIGLTDNIRKNISSKGPCVLLSLDLTKAFDRVNHSLIIHKLYRYFGFSRSACNLIASYLAGRKQYVVSSGCSSGLLPVYSGVPQGSVLGPLLFIMFVDDLYDKVSSSICQPFSFADDVQLLFKGDSMFPEVLQASIDHTVDLLCNWMSDNCLSVNPFKTKAMLFGDSGNNNFTIVLNNNFIEFVDKIKCLGIFIDTKLTFDSHVNSVISKVNFMLRKLYSLDLLLPFYIKERVIHGLIMPIFLYGLEVYSGTLGYIIKRVRLAFNRVMRYLYSLKLSQHVSCYVSKFLGFTFEDFIKFRCLLHFYKIYKLKNPQYLVELFEFGRSIRNKQLKIPMLTSILERSFLVRISRDFNKLPISLREFNLSVCTYKKKLKQSFV